MELVIASLLPLQSSLLLRYASQDRGLADRTLTSLFGAMAFLAKLGGVARQSVKTLLRPAAALAISNSTNSLRSSTHTISYSTGISQGLWGHRTGFVGSMWGAGNQQVRNVMVEVTNDDLERAIRKMKRMLKVDKGIRLLRELEYYRKPSEFKVLARKERDKRNAKKVFRAKLKWIQARQARGF